MNLPAGDRVELLDLVHRYAAYVDDRDLAGAAALFAPDGVLVRPDPPTHLTPVHAVTGPAAVEDALGALRGVPVTVHEVVGAVLDPAAGPNTARGRITCIAHHVTHRDDSWSDLVWHLRYLDDYVRTPHGWRFARRELHIDLIETRPVRRARADSEEQS